MSYTSYSILFLICLLSLASVNASPHYYCQKYIEEAARKTGVLPEILWAVAKTESNFGGKPWPWTVNVKGKGYYFSDKLSAKKFLKSLPEKIQYRVDVGCMQINWGYHGKAFSHLTKMINPRINVIYAAYFLRELYAETGEWSKAVASYHSRKWHRGGKYANKVALLVKDYKEKTSSKTPASIPFPFSDPSYKGRR